MGWMRELMNAANLCGVAQEGSPQNTPAKKKSHSLFFLAKPFQMALRPGLGPFPLVIFVPLPVPCFTCACKRVRALRRSFCCQLGRE